MSVTPKTTPLANRSTKSTVRTCGAARLAATSVTISGATEMAMRRRAGWSIVSPPGVRSRQQRRQRMRRAQCRGGAEHHLAVGGADVEDGIGKGDEPAPAAGAGSAAGPERHLVEAPLRQ